MPTSRSADLVGRDAELAELCSRLGIAASQPLGGALLLAGDAGVGKTRLLSELRDAAVAAGWHVVAGHCLDLSDSALPYLPFTEILGRLATELPEVTEQALNDQPILRRLQPGRRVRATDAAESTHDGSGHESSLERADLFEAIRVLLERAAEQAPLLVIVEDAHWADQSTRDLLSYLFTRAELPLVVSYRSDDLHRRHPLRRQLAQWSRLRVERMQLEPLDSGSVRQLVHSLHPDPIDEADVADIVERAEGNAFFVEELVGAARATGGVPADLAEVLLVRLDGLDPDAQQVVRTAAVAGRRVSHDLLAAACGLGEPELEEALRTAVERHVLEAVGGEAYSFRHALLAEAVYDDLLPGERVRRHAAYAAVLRSGAVLGTSAELARHALLGQDLPTALAASVDAGDEAMRVGGPQEAAQHYQQALELLDHPAILAVGSATAADVDPVDLTLRAAEALTAAGHVERANKVLREALGRLPAQSPAQSTAQPTDQAAAGEGAVPRGLLLSRLALGLFLADMGSEELELADESVRLLAAGTEVQLARAMATQARILSGHRREAEAREVGTIALAMSQRLDMPRLSADILTTLAGLRRDLLGDDVRDALAEVIGEARRTGAAQAELRGLFGLARLHQDRGEFEEALALFERCHALGVAEGLPWAPYSFDGLFFAGAVQLVLGRWDDVLATAAHAHKATSPAIAAVLRGLELTVAAGRGGPDAAALAQSLRGLWPDDGMIALYAAGAELEMAEQRADVAAALGTYEHAVAVLGPMWRELFQARLRLAALTLGVLGTAARTQSAAERSAARDAAESLLADGRRVVAYYKEEGLVFGPETQAWIRRLEAEHLRWRWLAQVDPPELDGLREAWEQTEARFAEFGHLHEVARVRIRLAEVLRGAGDGEAARATAELARAAAQTLGAEPLLAELSALALIAAGSASAPGNRQEAPDDVPAPERLTPRETEILALVAQGRSNGEIGKQLFIATKTVSVHVSNILAKLGAASRTEAAALARRRGLLD